MLFKDKHRSVEKELSIKVTREVNRSSFTNNNFESSEKYFYRHTFIGQRVLSIKDVVTIIVIRVVMQIFANFLSIKAFQLSIDTVGTNRIVNKSSLSYN